MEMGPVDEENNSLEKRVNCCSGGSKVYRVVGVSFGLLCIIQSALNVSLRLQGSGFYNKSDLRLLASTANISALLLEKEQLAEEHIKLWADNDKLTRDNKLLMDQLKWQKDQIMELQTENENLMMRISNMASEMQSCPRGWSLHKSSCYYISTRRETWAAANKDCTAKGAHLVILDDAEEKDFLRTYGSAVSWIGLRAEWNGQLKTWTWVDGSQLTDVDRIKLLPGGQHVYCAYAEQLYAGIVNFVPDDCRAQFYWVCEKKLK